MKSRPSPWAVGYLGRGPSKPTAGVSSSGRVLDFAGTREIQAAAVSGDSPGRQGGDAVRPALMSIGDTAHAAKDAFGDIDVGHFGAPGGWPVQRFSPQSSLRHVCPTIVIIGHTEYAQKRGKLKKPYCTDWPYSRKSTSWSNRPAAPLARPNMPPTGQPTVATRSIRPPASTARLRRFAPSRRAGRWRAAGWKRPILRGLP